MIAENKITKTKIIDSLNNLLNNYCNNYISDYEYEYDNAWYYNASITIVPMWSWFGEEILQLTFIEQYLNWDQLSVELMILKEIDQIMEDRWYTYYEELKGKDLSYSDRWWYHKEYFIKF